MYPLKNSLKNLDVLNWLLLASQDVDSVYNVCLQPEVLVKCLQELENSASSDAVVREQIAALPAEVSDIKKLDDLKGTHLSKTHFDLHS